MNKILIVILATVLGLSAQCFGFDLLKYRWGESKDSVEARLKEEGRTLEETSAPELIVFVDNYAGSSRKVTLIFTPKSLGLAMLQIEWDDHQITRDALKTLKSRYGEPYKLDNYKLHYEWNGAFSQEKIVLDGNKLSIYGGDYYQQYLKEKSGI